MSWSWIFKSLDISKVDRMTASQFFLAVISISTELQYIPRIMHMVYNIYVLSWLGSGWFSPYSSGLLAIAPGAPLKQTRKTYVNHSYLSTENYDITKTEQINAQQNRVDILWDILSLYRSNTITLAQWLEPGIIIWPMYHYVTTTRIRLMGVRN